MKDRQNQKPEFDTPEQLAVKVYAAIAIATLFITGLIAFVVSTAYRIGIP